MGLHHHRKLLLDGPDPCGRKKIDCLTPYPFPPPFGEEGYEDTKTPTTKHTTKISTALIITFAVVATAFFFLCSYAIYAKFFSSRNRSRRRLLSRQQTEAEGFDDEEQDPVVDHPIWYIRTTGLQQSVIGAITVCKYKRGEGLIEGTDCSVCLSEFQEDENLRLLPKCNHAFHLPCIDTWLRSHTNCPLCRAPIVTDPTIRFIPSSVEANAVASSSLENAQREGLEHSGGQGSGGMEDSEEGEQVEEGRRVCETAETLASEVVNMQPRRSVSLDSSSAAKISLALASVMSVESNRNSKRVSGNGKGQGGSSSSSSRTRYLHSEPSSMKRSRSFNAKHLISLYSRSQRKPNPPVRSF